MAMTKAEKTRMEELERELKAMRSLGWRDYSPVLIPAPRAGGDSVNLGFTANSHSVSDGRISAAVQYAASRSNSHIDSHDKAVVERWANGGGYMGGSQRGIDLWATRRSAFMHLRLEYARAAARILADLDDAIAAKDSSNEE